MDEITLEMFDGALRRVVETYDEFVAKIGNPDQEQLSECALRAMDTMDLSTFITMRTTSNRDLAEFLREENERLVEIIVAISRIQREGAPGAKDRVDQLVFAAHMEWSMRFGMAEMLFGGS